MIRAGAGSPEREVASTRRRVAPNDDRRGCVSTGRREPGTVPGPGLRTPKHAPCDDLRSGRTTTKSNLVRALLTAPLYAAVVAAAMTVIPPLASGTLFRRRRAGSAARSAALATFEAMQDRDRRGATEEIAFLEEDWTASDGAGDCSDRTASSPDEEPHPPRFTRATEA
jgi:hypothetical protein